MQVHVSKKTFEMMLGRHCGPALSGIKPSNMISIKKDKLPLFNNLLCEYNENMNQHDIYFSIINETETIYLVLVYRKEKLKSHLNKPEINSLLREEGYPCESTSIDSYIKHLNSRFNGECCPPDEIGIFLGYPIEDVMGFKQHRGKNCLMSKYWKVYSDVNEAEKLFERYDRCKKALCRRLISGTSIIDMFAKSA